MNLLKSSLVTIAAALIGVLPLAAQTTPSAPQKARVASTGGTSPHETFSVVLGDRKNGDRITIVYGRPYSVAPKTGELRKIWGGLIGGPPNPWGKPWRAGSDEATLFITQKTLLVGDATVPPGAYTLFLIPYQDGTAKLVVNKQFGQWGEEYDQSQDLARIDTKKDGIDPRVDEFTMAIAKGKDGNGVLKLIWENTQYSVPLTLVK